METLQFCVGRGTICYLQAIARRAYSEKFEGCLRGIMGVGLNMGMRRWLSDGTTMKVRSPIPVPTLVYVSNTLSPPHQRALVPH